MESELSTIQLILDSILQAQQYCQVQSMLTCINDVTSTLLDSLQSSFSSSITTTNTTMGITALLSSAFATSMDIITTTSTSITASSSSAFATSMGIITTSSFHIITNTLSTSSLDTSVTGSSQLAPELIATIIVIIVLTAIIVIIILCLLFLLFVGRVSLKPLNQAALKGISLLLLLHEYA